MSLRCFGSSAPVDRWIRFVGEDGNVHLGEDPAGAAAATILTRHNGGPLQRSNERMLVKKLLAPIVPTDIFCIGLNYMAHYEEGAKKRGMPLPDKPTIFMKPSSTVINPYDEVWLPTIEHGEQLDWEAELTVIIGKVARNVKACDALDHVAGYTVGNDISLRHWQRNAGASQWVKGKSFDTFCPIGPVFVTSAAIPDPQQLRCITRVNGEVVQDFNTDDMIFSVAECIEWLSHNMTLLPGSIVMTGTGSGIGAGRSPPIFLKEGDVLETEIPGIGTLRNGIMAPPTNDQAIARLLGDMSERVGCTTSPL
jgi:2-keto-4-pentenoate hydratase/2-oxohepta-3-ene-1,7-dioic acid hydratase in catechol pathway